MAHRAVCVGVRTQPDVGARVRRRVMLGSWASHFQIIPIDALLVIDEQVRYTVEYHSLGLVQLAFFVRAQYPLLSLTHPSVSLNMQATKVAPRTSQYLTRMLIVTSPGSGATLT